MSIREQTVIAGIIHIPLTRGYVAMVDEIDAVLVAGRSWFAVPVKDHYVYAAARIDGKVVGMHRHLLSAPSSVLVDHEDGNTLNNRRRNIRLATKGQNEQNQGLSRRSSTGVKGVWINQCGNFATTIMVDKRKIYLGTYGTLEEAAAVRAEAAKRYHGEFARMTWNEPSS